MSQQAIEKQNPGERAATAASETGEPHASSPDTEDKHGNADDGPEVILWAALSLAPYEGVTVPDLMTATGMSRPWIYQRLRGLIERSQAVQVSRGRWRAASGDSA